MPFIMKKVKIKMLKITLDNEMVTEYGANGLTSCLMMEGHTFYTIYTKPDGFYDEV